MALSFGAGVLHGLRYGSPWPGVLGLGAALLVFAVRRMHRATTVLLLTFVALGVALGATANSRAQQDCRSTMQDGAHVVLSGVLTSVAGDPVDGSSVRVDAERVRVDGRDLQGCGGVFRLHVRDEGPLPRVGEMVEARGEWFRYAPPVVRSAWPRDPAGRGSLRAHTLRTADESSGFHPMLRLRDGGEERLAQLVPHHAGVARALLFGRSDLLEPELRDQYARSGLAHLLAISGLHVGLIAGILLMVGSILRLSRRRAAWLALLVLAVYLATIGAPASALRAGLMITAALAGAMLQRPHAALPVIAAAALILLLIDPLVVLRPGAQLSFAGVLGILYARVRLLPSLPAVRFIPSGVLDGLAFSLAAFVATAPVTAFHFGGVSLIAVFANLPAVPVMALAVAGLSGALLLDPFIPVVAQLLAAGAGAALTFLDGIARAAASVPGGYLTVSNHQLWVACGAALVGSVATWHLRSARRTARLVVGAGLFCMVVAFAPQPWWRGVEVHFVDVGQGDAVAIRTDRGRWILVDTGPRTDDYDAGARRVLPFLRATGANELEALVLTHPDADHVGGAEVVLKGIPVRRVVEPGLPVAKEPYQRALRLVEERNIPWIAARAGRTLRVDGVTMEFLWPEGDALDEASEANEISAVVRLHVPGFTLLLTGDVSSEVEERLVRRYGDLRADVLKAGHHGSRTSTSEELLRSVRPSLAVVSAGRRNRYGHPSPVVLQRLQEHGVEVARTDLQGTISIRVAPDGRWRWEGVIDGNP